MLKTMAEDPNREKNEALTQKLCMLRTEAERMLNSQDIRNFDLRRYWQLAVPLVMSVKLGTVCFTRNYDERAIYEHLLQPMERYVFGQNSEEVLRQLFVSGMSSRTRCAKVFLISDSTYSCKDCRTCPTCVLCSDCFHKSEHVNHRYTVSLSMGGTVCNCGDAEAWLQSPNCTNHVSATSLSTIDKEAQGNEGNAEIDGELSEEVKAKLRDVLNVVCQYAYKMLVDSNLDMSSEEQSDEYCTILYNDESHIFEHVIRMVMKIVKCSKKKAIDFVIDIDHEGRGVLACASLEKCVKVRRAVCIAVPQIMFPHSPVPLTVKISHSIVIAHQEFALRLLTWLHEKILPLNATIRKLFCDLMMDPEQLINGSIAEAVLKKDKDLWKAARLNWHRLFITGMMLDYPQKLRFAELFSDNYKFLALEFIRDDQDRQYSITNLSVQLFTVPSIAHHLIASNKLLSVMINLYKQECRMLLNENEQMVFDRIQLRRMKGSRFERANELLKDVEYVLSVPPASWNTRLREEVHKACLSFLELLKIMHGMDPIVRPMEDKQDLETSFNWATNVAPIIKALALWCKSDGALLIKTYRDTMKKLNEYAIERHEFQLRSNMNFCGIWKNIILYNVGCQPVSIHLPLTRFWGLLHAHLNKYGLKFDEVLLGNARCLPDEVLEPVSRIFALRAQVLHANMWTINGDSVRYQMWSYECPKNRGGALDVDLSVVQSCVTLMNPDHLLLSVLSKLDPFLMLSWYRNVHLTNYLWFFDFIEPKLALIEEFLLVIIHVIAKRYEENVAIIGETDFLRKEVIQYLCVKPRTHSEIEKLIPKSLESLLDTILNEVANFHVPFYILKDEYESQYDVFYYHYHKKDVAIAQDYMRARREAKQQHEWFPPPQLPPLKESHYGINKLLQSRMMLSVMEKVLQNCLEHDTSMFTEGQVHRVLHLLGYALNECQTGRYPFLGAEYLRELRNHLIPVYLECLPNNDGVKNHWDLVKWTLDKYNLLTAADSSKAASLTMETDETSADENKEKDMRAQLVEQRRQTVMSEMAAQQNQFMKDNEAMLLDVEDNLEKETGGNSRTKKDSQKSDTVAVGANRSKYIESTIRELCVVCREEQVVDLRTSLSEPLILGAFVQTSTVMRMYKAAKDGPIPPGLHWQDRSYLQASLGPAIYVSCCGHAMHANCYKYYFTCAYAIYQEQVSKGRNPSSFDMDKGEFQCPLCQSLCNTVVPFLPPIPVMRANVRDVQVLGSTFEDWIAYNNSCISQKNEAKSSESTGRYEEIWLSIAPGGSRPSGRNRNGGHRRQELSSDVRNPMLSLSRSNTRYGVATGRAVQVLHEMKSECFPVFTLLEFGKKIVKRCSLFESPSSHPLNSTNVFPKTILIWKACSYTIHVVESVLRVNESKSLLGHLSFKQAKTVSSLVKVSSFLQNCRVDNVTSFGKQLMGMVMQKPEIRSDACILGWDTFDVLVSLTLCPAGSVPFKQEKTAPLPYGSILDSYILKLMTVASIAQILLQPISEEDLNVASIRCQEEEEEDCEALGMIMQLVRKHHFLDKKEGISNAVLWEHVKLKLRRFLRCCSIFYHYLSGLPAPNNLVKAGGDTYENMCEYLGLDGSCSGLLGNKDGVVYKLLMSRWIETAASQLKSSRVVLLKDFLPANSLVALPEKYSDLIDMVGSYRCPKIVGERRNPMMCLACGSLLCSESFCCQREYKDDMLGAVAYHTISCGAYSGIFLNIRQCKIVIVSYADYPDQSRGIIMSAPYVDRFGEIDDGFERGNELMLSQQSYAKLSKLWLYHELHDELNRRNDPLNVNELVVWESL